MSRARARALAHARKHASTHARSLARSLALLAGTCTAVCTPLTRPRSFRFERLIFKGIEMDLWAFEAVTFGLVQYCEATRACTRART